MSLGRREMESQGELWVATSQMARAPGHVFYQRLNRLLREAGFDAYVEELCEPVRSKYSSIAQFATLQRFFDN